MKFNKAILTILGTGLFVNSLYAENIVVRQSSDSATQRLDKIEHILENMRESQAQLSYTIESMRSEIQSMRGEVEEHSFQLERLSERQRDMYRDIDSRLNELKTQAAVVTPQQVEQSSSASSAESKSTTVSEHTAYNDVFGLVRSKKYNQAIQAYQQFLQNYPNSRYVPDSYYWIGQMYYAQRKLDNASESLQVVVDKYPDSKKASGALFRLAVIMEDQNKISQAKYYYQQIITDYPDKSEAKKAKQKLDSL
jgi:tol-pal system protein YbgF